MKNPKQLKEHAFPRHRQDHTQKHPNGYLTPLLKKILNKKFNIEDPETQKIIKMTGANGVMLRLVWSSLQGEVPAIKEILDRLDGKVTDKLKISVEEITGKIDKIIDIVIKNCTAEQRIKILDKLQKEGLV